VPKSILPKLMRLGLNDLGVSFVNSAKYFASRHLSHHHHYRQSLVAFNFLLDYIPNWQYGYGPRGLMQYQCFIPLAAAPYGPRGLMQYQCFIPLAAAPGTLSSVLSLTQQRGLPNYLGVVKRHRPDRFLMSHAVDGYSLAMDFPAPATPRGLARTTEMTHDLDHLVLEAGGRFYFAKDSTLTPHAAQRFLGDDTLARFHALKTRCDPAGLLQTQLYRRLLAPSRALAAAAGPAQPRAEHAPQPVPVPAPHQSGNGGSGHPH
jgi:decaprenylphospho-beta-D-ribofuranose 2-oxidase